jgi:uncharacterized cysteine cluster protein YcgN (CxxCxxCC family)
MKQNEPFWEKKTFKEMTHEEWESLCDGCAKCCLHKIEDIDSGMVYTTDVACRLLDLKSCRCKDYRHRKELVSDCLQLTPEVLKEITWLPRTCAYRRLAEGRGLAWWHPLVSGDPDTVIRAGISVCGKVVPEEMVNMADIEDRVVDWFD